MLIFVLLRSFKNVDEKDGSRKISDQNFICDLFNIYSLKILFVTKLFKLASSDVNADRSKTMPKPVLNDCQTT